MERDRLALRLEEVLDTLLNSPTLSASDVKWSFDGGDPVVTSKLIPSALWTAYSALASSLWREGEYWGKNSRLSLTERAILAELEEISGSPYLDDPDHSPEFYEERALAFYSWAMKFASTRDELGRAEFKWLFNLRTETGDANILVSFHEWCAARAATARTEDMAAAYRWIISTDSSWINEDGKIVVDLPTDDEAIETVREWLTEDCDDGCMEHATSASSPESPRGSIKPSSGR
jgi:hypothetical protein